MEIAIFLYSFLIPALFGSGLLALGWLLPPLRKRGWLQASMFGIALGAGLAGSYFAESGLPAFPPPRSDVWIGWLGPGLVVVSLLAVIVGLRRFPRNELFALLLGTVFACMPLLAWMAGDNADPKPLFPGMTGGDHVMMAIVIAFGVLVLGQLQEIRPGATIPCVLGTTFTACSLTALASGWITMSVLFGVLGAISGAAALIGRFSGSPAIGLGGSTAVVLLLVTLPLATWCKTTPPDDLHWWYWVILVAAPLLLLPLENRWFEKMPKNAAFWIRIVIVALPAIWVLIRIVPMLLGDSSDELDEMDEMMKMYQ